MSTYFFKTITIPDISDEEFLSILGQSMRFDILRNGNEVGVLSGVETNEKIDLEKKKFTLYSEWQMSPPWPSDALAKRLAGQKVIIEDYSERGVGMKYTVIFGETKEQNQILSKEFLKDYEDEMNN